MVDKQHTYKLNDGFNVTKFMMLVDVDFIYSAEMSRNTYLLLNQDMLGEFTKADVDNQKRSKKVIIIYNDTLKMEAYNVPEEELINAFMNMGNK